MSFLSRLFQPKPPPLSALWIWITRTAREPHWYTEFQVADSVDGRFDMVALVTALVMLDMENRGLQAETSALTERFVTDMDGSLRAIGISDMVMAKQMGRVVGALGGRITAYRAALSVAATPSELADVLMRNVYRGNAPAGVADVLADAVRGLVQRIALVPDDALLAGNIQ